MKRLPLALLLVMLLADQAAAQHKVEVYCPPMAVNKLRAGLWECEKIVTVGKVHLPGKAIEFSDFIIPPTLVRGVINRGVDPCVSFGHSKDMDQLWLQLPREPVRIKGFPPLPTALAMKAVGVLTLHTGEEYRLWVIYPDCPTDPVRGTFGRQRLARSVTAWGETLP